MSSESAGGGARRRRFGALTMNSWGRIRSTRTRRSPGRGLAEVMRAGLARRAPGQVRSGG
jgi:hypothetical protein